MHKGISQRRECTKESYMGKEAHMDLMRVMTYTGILHEKMILKGISREKNGSYTGRRHTGI